jgi:hypothetical protein
MKADNNDSDILGFFAEDRYFIKQLAKAVRDLVGRPATTPEQMHHLAKLLFALNRLPRRTSGLSIELTIGQRHKNGEGDHLRLTLDDSCLSLARDVYVIIDPSVGGDSAGETVFEVEEQSRELVEPTELMDWVEAFRARVADSGNELGISDAGNGLPFEWGTEGRDEDWEHLDSDYA